MPFRRSVLCGNDEISVHRSSPLLLLTVLLQYCQDRMCLVNHHFIKQVFFHAQPDLYAKVDGWRCLDSSRLHYKCEYKESRHCQTLLTGLRPAAYLGRVSTCDWCLVSLFDSDYPDDNWIGRLVGPRSPGPGPHKPDCKTPSVSRVKSAMELFLRDILSWCWPGTASCLVWPRVGRYLEIWRMPTILINWIQPPATITQCTAVSTDNMDICIIVLDWTNTQINSNAQGWFKIIINYIVIVTCTNAHFQALAYNNGVKNGFQGCLCLINNISMSIISYQSTTTILCMHQKCPFVHIVQLSRTTGI